MGSCTRMIVSLCLSQLLFAQEVAIALDSSQVVDQIRDLGLPEFIRNCMKDSQGLQYAMSPQQQAEAVAYAVRYSQGKLKDVKASTVCSMPGFEYNIIEVIQEGTTNIVFIQSATEASDSVFAISIVNLEDDTINNHVMMQNQVLDNVQMNPNLIDAMRRAVEDMFHKRDKQFLDDFERTLATKTSSLPTYVVKRLSGKTEESRRRFNSTLDFVQADGEVKYLGTKNIVGQHRISLFAVPTAWGPVVFLVHIVVLDTGPVVSDAMILVGTYAWPYINDYKKVFAASGTPVGQGAIK